ncbi:MAG TPA: hypothetical protein VFN44_19350 [Solirubrobacteraceae bacterium]|nr:hypothetical protein [Solirubrobacteraceae bacterium]
MTSRRSLIPAALAAAVALAPAAAAQAPPPTLTWDRGCYTEDQPMTFAGTGYTPGAPVDLVFSRGATVLGTYEATADAAGAVGDYVLAREDDLLAADQEREPIGASANDRTRSDQGEPPQATSAAGTFTFTRWMGFSPGRYVPGRRAAVEIYGWAFAEGRTAYFLFRKGRRTVASVMLGTIAGPCGDLKARAKVPRKLKAGAYKVWLSTDRRTPSTRSTWRTARVTRKASAATAGRAPMRRIG